MARPLRLEFAGALYHVTSRGDQRENIYESESDRKLFLVTLGKVCDRFNWRCHAYCLMNNHYHLLIETPEANLSKGMRQLNGVYTQSFNRVHNRVGHVFQGRYTGIFVEKQSYLLELARYIVRNPVRVGMVSSPQEWPWSSYRATTGQVSSPPWLTTEWLLASFGQRKSKAIERYKQFVAEGSGCPSPWAQLRNQIYLGDDKFVERLQALIDGEKELDEIPSSQRRPLPKKIAVYEGETKSRNEAIVKAYLSGGYTLRELGNHFGLHYSTISSIITNHKSKT